MNVDTDQFQALQAEVAATRTALDEIQDWLRRYAPIYETVYDTGYRAGVDHGRQRHTAPHGRNHLSIVRD